MHKNLANIYLVIMLSFCLFSCVSEEERDGNQEPYIINETLSGEVITFQEGVIIEGAPPEATNNQDDPYLTVVEFSNSRQIETGNQGEIAIQVNNIPQEQSFFIYLRFEQSDSYISLLIDSPFLINELAKNEGAGVLQLPFNVPISICNNATEPQLTLDYYASVNIGEGSMVSKEIKQQLILSCTLEINAEQIANSASDVGNLDNKYSLCVEDYPKVACDLLGKENINSSSIDTLFKENESCGNAFPKLPTTTVASGCESSGIYYSCGSCGLETKDLNTRSIYENDLFHTIENYRTKPATESKITFTTIN